MIAPRARAAVLAAALLVPITAFAHHGWSSFDTAKVLDQSGAVVRSSYANPHGTVVISRDGVDVTVELAPVSRMEARGLAEADIAAGKVVRVYAYQSRDNDKLYRAEWIEPAGKKRVELR